MKMSKILIMASLIILIASNSVYAEENVIIINKREMNNIIGTGRDWIDTGLNSRSI